MYELGSTRHEYMNLTLKLRDLKNRFFLDLRQNKSLWEYIQGLIVGLC